MPYRNLYIDTKEIVCRVDGPGVRAYRAGKIVVQVSDYRGESKTDYLFVDPQIEDFWPRIGPISGGTQVTIKGNFLNAGSAISATIDGMDCEILRLVFYLFISFIEISMVFKLNLLVLTKRRQFVELPLREASPRAASR